MLNNVADTSSSSPNSSKSNDYIKSEYMVYAYAHVVLMSLIDWSVVHSHAGEKDEHKGRTQIWRKSELGTKSELEMLSGKCTATRRMNFRF